LNAARTAATGKDVALVFITGKHLIRIAGPFINSVAQRTVVKAI
jgi:hypothetical protein